MVESGQGAMTLDLQFVTSFKPAYQRNRNSRTKTKNLRCFPDCTEGNKHEQFGFCGRTITATADIPTAGEQDAFDPEKLRAFAQFTLNDTPEPEVEWPHRKPKEEDLRSKKCPTRPWIPVTIKTTGAGNRLVFVVNPELIGWHYDWKSSKKDRNVRHCLRLYVYKRKAVITDTELLNVLKSPSFVLYSGNQVPDAQVSNSPIAANTNKRKPGELLSPRNKCEKASPVPRVSEKLDALNRMEKSVYGDNSNQLNRGVSVDSASDGKEKGLTMRALLLNAKAQLQQSSRLRKATNPIAEEADIVFTEEEASEFLDELLASTDDSILQLSSLDMEPSKPSQPNQMLDTAMIQEVVRIISSDDLIQDISQFINACTTGPLGSALVDVLDKLDSFDGLNPFVKEFSRSIFARFQSIISKKLQQDLSKDALKSTKGGMLYDINDDNKIYEFLKLIKQRSRQPNIREALALEKKQGTTTRFSAINRVWKASDPSYETWWLEVACEKHGLMDELQAKYLGKMYRSMAIYVSDNLVKWQGDKEFGNLVFSIIPDGKVHDMDKISFLLDYVELSKKKYIGYHFTSPKGDYFMDYCLWFKKQVKGVPGYCYYYISFKANNGSDKMELVRKLIVAEQELPPEVILPNCRSVEPMYLVGEGVRFIYNAEDSI